MSDQTRLLGLYQLDAPSGEDAPVSRVQLMQTGEFSHPRYGKFEITQDNLNEFADSIREQSDRVSIDYDHSFAETGSSLAAGWIQSDSVQVDKGGLWALVRWTKKAAEAIKSGEYKFISPEFSFVTRDRTTGEKEKKPSFLAAALTNRPFLREMAPVSLSDQTLAEVFADPPLLLSEFDYEDLCARYGQAVIRVLHAQAVNGDPDVREYIEALTAADKKPYGDVSYADPGYQSDGVKRYPIDNADHVRAAWSYINESDNADKYSAEQVDSIKNRIKAAAKRFEITINATTEGETEMNLAEIAELVGLDADAEESAVTAKLSEIKDKATKTDDLSELLKKKREKGATMTHEELISALNLSEDADEADVLAAVRRAKEAAEQADASAEELESLRATAKNQRKIEEQLKEIQSERRMEKISRILSDGVRSGKILPAEKNVLAKQFSNNPDGLIELVASRPDRVFKTYEIGTTGQMRDSEDIIGVKDLFASELADEVDSDSARLHLRAEQILLESGKVQYTGEEYASALELASRDSH